MPQGQGTPLRTKLLIGLAGTAVFGLCSFFLPAPTNPDYSGKSPDLTRRELNLAINWYAEHYHLDPALLKAVIKAESGFDPEATSRKGAIGLMQVMPSNAERLKVGDLYDPIQNIRAGAKQLRHLLDLYHGDLSLTLAAYNAGIRKVKHNEIPRIRETRHYVKKVLTFYEEFHRRQPYKEQPQVVVATSNRPLPQYESDSSAHQN
ncbi:MAG: lytic transglycosylase domain-containing protein [Nitrospirae bacterium]|nr:lytic transglycosylase domain-containing protein [Nitrospirota bacterium]